MEKSQSITNIAKSLIKFKGLVGKIERKSVNKFRGTKYASLTDILDAIDPALIECGLALSHFPEGSKKLISILMHAESGEYMQCESEIDATVEGSVEKEDAESDLTSKQIRGSNITYLRRYATCAILNLNVDDAKESSGGEKKPSLKDMWLNEGPEMDRVIKELMEEKITMDDVRKEFRLSREIEFNLRQMLLKDLWKGKKIPACKTRAELAKLYNEHAGLITNWPDLKLAFKNHQETLPKLEKQMV